MSFIYRDFLTPSRFAWNRASALYHKFDKVWPKEMDGEVAVYSPIMYYWAGALRSDVPFKRFVNALGVEYAQLQNSSYDGVDNVYFKLEPGKYVYTAPEKAAIVADLNSVFNVGDEFELFVHYSGQTRRVVEGHWKLKTPTSDPDDIRSYTVDTAGIRAKLHSDPLLYFANALIPVDGEYTTAGVKGARALPTAMQDIALTAARNSPRTTPVTRVERNEDTTHIYATLALLDNGSVFQQQGSVYNELVTVKKTAASDVYFEYAYKVKYKVVAEATTTSYVVGQIDVLSNTMEAALGYKGGNVYMLGNRAADTVLKEAVIAMNNVEAIGLMYNGKLRVDAVALMKRKDFTDMLGKIFGTGYTKKKAKWYEKAIAIVLVVVAVVVGVASGGGLAAVSSSLVAAATALATAGLVLSLGMMLYASAFPNATDQTRMIGKFAQIVGLAATITGVMAAIQNAWNQAAQQAVKEGTITAAKDYTLKQFAADMASKLWDSVKSGVMDKVTMITNPGQWSLPRLTDMTMADVGGWLRNIGDGLKTYMKFFGEQKQYSTMTEDEQAVKEDGVEGVFLAYEMVDNVDALYRMDNMVRNNLGGQKTENFLTQIA